MAAAVLRHGGYKNLSSVRQMWGCQTFIMCDAVDGENLWNCFVLRPILLSRISKQFVRLRIQISSVKYIQNCSDILMRLAFACALRTRWRFTELNFQFYIRARIKRVINLNFNLPKLHRCDALIFSLWLFISYHKLCECTWKRYSTRRIKKVYMWKLNMSLWLSVCFSYSIYEYSH